MVTQLIGRSYCVFVVGLMILSLCLSVASAKIVITDSGTIESADISNNHFDVYDDLVVWTDSRNVGENPPDYPNYDIYMYNISTGQEKQITTDEKMQSVDGIYKNIICWTDRRSNNDNPKIYYYDLSLDKEMTTETERGWKGRFSVFKNRMVYTDDRNDTDVFVYDLEKQQESQITFNESAQGTVWEGQSAIWEDRVVYEDERSGNYDIWYYNLTTGERKQITSNDSDEEEPAIWGDIVVWRNRKYEEIWAYNLKNEETFFVSSGAHTPDIYGKYIVFGGIRDISIFNVSVKEWIDLPVPGMTPRIWKDTIVYEEDDQLKWLKFEFVSDEQPEPEDDDPDYLPYLLLTIAILASIAGTFWYRKTHRKA